MNNFSYKKASSFEDAIATVTVEGDASFIAGGTNLIDLMKYGVAKPTMLIDLNDVKEHGVIQEKADGGIRLDALVSNAKTAYHPLVEERYPILSRAILAGASAQIRNMATNGGNLLQRTRCYYFYDVNTPCNKRIPGSGCSAIGGYNRNMAILGTSDSCIAVFPSDMCVALAALDAEVNIAGADGNRSIRFMDFHRLPGSTPHIENNLQPGEVITSIDLPPKGFSENYSYLKLRDRNSYAFALVSVATGLDLRDNIIGEARIALGGLAHIPWRAKDGETFLRGKQPTATNFTKAAEIILSGAVGYKYNAFKIDLAKRAIVRNCMMALDPQSQLPGAPPSD